MVIMIAPLAAGILGGSSLLGGWLTGRQNKKSQQFSRDMYDRQYKDTVKFWNMQNEYNDPRAQVERLRAAGLNPALMYGGGAGSGAAGQSEMMKTPDVQAAQFRTPRFDKIGEVLSQYYDYRIKQAQVDNVEAQTNAITNDMLINLDKWRGGIDFNKYSRGNFKFLGKKGWSKDQGSFKAQIVPYSGRGQGLMNWNFVEQRTSNLKKEQEVMAANIAKAIADTKYTSEQTGLLQWIKGLGPAGTFLLSALKAIK